MKRGARVILALAALSGTFGLSYFSTAAAVTGRSEASSSEVQGKETGRSFTIPVQGPYDRDAWEMACREVEQDEEAESIIYICELGE